ncbi:MAG: helix-turn-helix domain-containing protein [Kofleriaceae bacterium]
MRALVREIVREELAGAKPSPPSDPKAHLSTRAAAQHAGVAIGTIRRWVRDGKLRELRAGRHLRVRRSDIDALLHGERDCSDISPEELARQAFGG